MVFYIKPIDGATDIIDMSVYATNQSVTDAIQNLTDVKIHDEDPNSAYKLAITVNETLTANRLLNVKTNNANRLLDISGDLKIANNFTTVGNHSLTFTQTNTTVATLPSGIITLADTTTAQNILNKTIIGNESTYNTGTASQTMTTITGVGTTFTQSMVGCSIVFADGVKSLISAYVSATELTSEHKQSGNGGVAGNYTIYRGGSHIYPDAGIGTSNFIARGSSGSGNGSLILQTYNSNAIKITTPTLSNSYTMTLPDTIASASNMALCSTGLNSTLTWRALPILFERTLTTSEFLGLYSTPIELLPALSANKIYCFTSGCAFYLNHNTEAFSGGGDVYIYPTGANYGNYRYMLQHPNTFRNGANTLAFNNFGGTSQYDVNTKGVSITNSVGAFSAGGTSTVSIKFYYYVMSF